MAARYNEPEGNGAMSEARAWHARRWVRVLLAVLVALGGWIWWRMGGVRVEVDESILAAMPLAHLPVEFTVLTYNVQGRPWFDDTRHKFPRISPLLNQFDLVGIQECFKDHGRLWSDADHPVKIYHSRLKHPGKIVGSGLGLLGKYPLVETAAINFDALGEFQNKPASKGVLMARFDVAGAIVDLYTTHIEAGKSPEALQAKIGQGEEITAFVRAQSPLEHTVIFTGDFNMRPSRGPEDKEENKDNPRVWVFDKMVEDLDLRDASDEINGPVGTEIDRILFRPGTGHTLEVLSWQKDDPVFYDEAGEPLSDHDPVFARFRLEAK